MPTVFPSEHNVLGELNATDGPTVPSVPALSSALPRHTQPNDTHGKENTNHATSDTAVSSIPRRFKKQRRYLLGFLCALLGPDLEGYTKEELHLAELRSNVEFGIVINYFMRLFPVLFVVSALFFACMLAWLAFGGHQVAGTQKACVEVADHVCNCGSFWSRVILSEDRPGRMRMNYGLSLLM